MSQRQKIVFHQKYQWPLAACLAAIINGVRLAKGLESFKNGCCKIFIKTHNIRIILSN